MAESEGNSATPWIAFLVGIVLVAIVAVGYFAYSGAPQQTAQITVPDVNIDTPDINLPEPPPAPELPKAEPAPAQ